MIDFVALSRAMRRARFVLSAVAILLALITASTTLFDWPALAHRGGDRSARGGPAAASDTDRSITAEDVSTATRGKAVFRTLRLAASKPIDETGRFRYSGASFRGGEACGYVKDTKTNETIKLKIGDSLAGQFEVVKIHADRIELKRGGEIVALRKK